MSIFRVISQPEPVLLLELSNVDIDVHDIDIYSQYSEKKFVMTCCVYSPVSYFLFLMSKSPSQCTSMSKLDYMS